MKREIRAIVNSPQWRQVPNAFKKHLLFHLHKEIETMGGFIHRKFAALNHTPAVHKGHICHPIALKSRGFIDGKGWPIQTHDKVKMILEIMARNHKLQRQLAQ